MNDFRRLNYTEIVADVLPDGKSVVLNDQMNKFLDGLIEEVESAGSGVTFDGGSLANPINGFLDGGSL